MRLFVLGIFAVMSSAAFGADIEWSGLYRVEGVSIYKPDLTNPDRQLDYALQHFIMRPKIVASDGLTIRSQFDIFNSPNAYPNTHMGQVWGTPRPPGGTGPSGTNTSADQSSTFSENGVAGDISVTQLYLTWDFEYGSIIAGRAPLQFGLGMTYSAGMGMFDHYYDSLDMIGAKLVYGNFFVMPMLGKSSTGQFNRDDDVDDYLIQAQYENPEDDIEMGVMYHVRHSGDQGSDAPMNTAYNTSGTPTGEPIFGASNPTSLTSGVNIQRLNLYALKDTPRMRAGVEFGYQQGETGVRWTSGPTGGDRITLSGVGVAGEFEWRPEDSDWKLGLKAGYATGNDPSNASDFNGFIFNRNYDVAFLLFNHPLGQFDVFHTRLVGGGGGPVNTPLEINKTDTDAISNVLYFAPYVTYRMNERWNMKAVLATAYLNNNSYYDDYYDGTNTQLVSGSGRDVGYEFDYSVNFAPRKGVMWTNEVGLLFPGSAFEGDGTMGNGFTYGFQSRAAISF